jgi:hypothetical protein
MRPQRIVNFYYRRRTCPDEGSRNAFIVNQGDREIIDPIESAFELLSRGDPNCDGLGGNIGQCRPATP